MKKKPAEPDTSATNDQWAVRYRPTTMDEFVASDYIKEQVETFKERPPNVILITGDTGNGKTTLAFLIARMLTDYSQDIHDVNAASDGGVDNVRSLIQSASFKPRGKRRVFIIDEAHALSYQATQAFLKPMEDPKAPVTWIICTNMPHKLNAAMMTRSRNLSLGVPPFEPMDRMLIEIGNKEKVKSYAGFQVLRKKDLASAKKMLRLLRKSAINASNGSMRTAVTNYQSLCALLLGSMKGVDAKTLGKKLTDAATALTSGFNSDDINILELLRKEPGEAAAALVNARDLSLFNKLFYAAKDSVAENRQSELATRVLLYCNEALHWAAFSNQNPSVHLAAKFSAWAVNEKHKAAKNVKKKGSDK